MAQRAKPHCRCRYRIRNDIRPLSVDLWLKNAGIGRSFRVWSRDNRARTTCLPSLWGSRLQLLLDEPHIPLAHDYEGAPHQLETTSVLDAFVPLNDTKKVVIGQHLKYDLNVPCSATA